MEVVPQPHVVVVHRSVGWVDPGADAEQPNGFAAIAARMACLNHHHWAAQRPKQVAQKTSRAVARPPRDGPDAVHSVVPRRWTPDDLPNVSKGEGMIAMRMI